MWVGTAARSCSPLARGRISHLGGGAARAKRGFGPAGSCCQEVLESLLRGAFNTINHRRRPLPPDPTHLSPSLTRVRPSRSSRSVRWRSGTTDRIANTFWGAGRLQRRAGGGGGRLGKRRGEGSDGTKGRMSNTCWGAGARERERRRVGRRGRGNACRKHVQGRVAAGEEAPQGRKKRGCALVGQLRMQVNYSFP